jgi:CRISPR-associated protein Cas1
MDTSLLNTLYVQTRGLTLRRDHQTVLVNEKKKTLLTVPIHNLESIVVWGGIHVTPHLLNLCLTRDVSVNYLTDSGRFLGRLISPGHGNVLLRRQQFRQADNETLALEIVRSFVAGKIRNSRSLVVRGVRECSDEVSKKNLQTVADRMAESLIGLEKAESIESARGYEGDAARLYFSVFSHLIIPGKRNFFRFEGRTRRPPLDPVNCLLSFGYGLLLQECCSAAAVTGMDPGVGFLHVDRPGRPGLALDLMEEFRALLVDRMVLALINRSQLQESDFEKQPTGAIILKPRGRKELLGAWQLRKKEIIRHPLLGTKTAVGLLPCLQARILARTIRGELPQYIPFIPKG